MIEKHLMLYVEDESTDCAQNWTVLRLPLAAASPQARDSDEPLKLRLGIVFVYLRASSALYELNAPATLSLTTTARNRPRWPQRIRPPMRS